MEMSCLLRFRNELSEVNCDGRYSYSEFTRCNARSVYVAYVWSTETPQGHTLDVGRTGDNSRLQATTPHSRMG
jgi:hypothetical protein